MMRGRISILMFAGLFPAIAGAQVPEAPDDFGTQDESITMVAAREFFPEDSSNPYHGNDWSRWSGFSLDAPINHLPNGALLTQVAFYLDDESPGEDFLGLLCYNAIASSNPGLIEVNCTLGSVSSVGTPGRIMLFFSPNERIQYRQGDPGSAYVYNYFLRVYTTADQSIDFHMARLRWRREVSPAPQTATFGDVPTNHQFFQFIEALSDSGITAGCGNGNYCPDAPLTRGQMAVFLAKALGLHWPWDAP